MFYTFIKLRNMGHIYKILKPGNEEYKILCEKFITPLRTGYVEIDQGVCVLPEKYLNYCRNYQEFKVRDTDVFVIGFPKTGTTWTQEMVWLIANNVDFEAAKTKLCLRFPFFDQDIQRNVQMANYETMIDLLNDMNGRRFIKTHFPWSLLPVQIVNNEKQPKMIYVMRNPKDTCVSAFHFFTSLGFSGNFEEFTKLYLSGQLDYGSFWNHLLSYWKQSRKNLLFITYEEMITDMPNVIGKVAKFLGKSLTEAQISALTKHLHFESMRKNNAVNYEGRLKEIRKNYVVNKSQVPYMRSGKLGAYGSDMSPEIVAKFDELTCEKFKEIGFPYLDTMLL